MRLIGIDVDITERKRLEDEQRQNEARFRAVLGHSPIVIFTQDSDLRYTWICNSLLGFRVEEILARISHSE